MIQPGVAAPAIELPDIQGTTQTPLGGLSNGPVVLVFYKTSCPTCQLTFPFLERLAASANLVAVSQDDARDSREFNQRCGVTFPTLLDARPYPVSNAYQITNVPSLFIIESDGRVSFAVHGFNKAALEKLGDRFGVPVFSEPDHVPDLRPG
jgi:peroxiredoxin